MDVAILGIKSIPASGGADRVVEKLLENLGTHNDYWIYIRRDSPRAATCHDNLHFIHVPALRGKHLGSFTFFLLCCLHYLLKGRYDLAHVHNSDFGLFVPLLRLKRGVPVMGTFHGDPYQRAKWEPPARFYLRLSERFFAQFCHRLTSVSRFKSSCPALWGRRSVQYIPNGVDPYWKDSSPESFDCRQFGLRRGEYVLFACGRLDPTKGLHHLLAAWAMRPLGRRLLIVGDFSHDPAYSERMNRLIEADESIVALRSLLPRAALLEALRGCRVFVFPSEYEGMSMMLLEAISCRRAVVCSDIPENREVLVEDYPYVHRNADAEHLCERLAAALADPELDAWSQRLFDRCMRDFAWPVVAASYERIYHAYGPPSLGAAPG